MIKAILTLAVATSAMMYSNSVAFAEIKAETDQVIKVGTIGNPEGDFLSYTLGKVLEKAGYKVDFVKADYTAQFTAVELGDLDMLSTAWTNTPDLIDAAVKSGKVEDVGSTGLAIYEGWWYPTYLEKDCPGLPNWEALKTPACIAAFSSPEAPGKIRYIGTPADWTVYDEQRIEALGLQVEIVPAGTQAAMIAAMQGAISRKEGVMGYGMSPHWLYDSDVGKFLELPPYEPACASDPAWGVNPKKVWDCAMPKGTVDKLINVTVKARAPGAYQILQRYKMDNKFMSQATHDVETGGKDIEDIADEWVSKNSTVWSEWLK